MAIVTVAEQNFEREVLRSETPVLVFFTADGASPCKQVVPEVEAVKRELEEKAKVVQVDIDRSKRLSASLRVQAVPTFIAFVKGHPVASEQGVLRCHQLRELLEPFLPRAEGGIRAIELAQLIQQNQVIAVDTRDTATYPRAHLPGAHHIPLEELEARLDELQMLNGEPVLYCATGDKTRDLSRRLAEAGLPVSFLEGGFLAWEQEGLPIERPD